MVNDVNTLNGALAELGELMADNLVSQGVTGASASDGLTTLANKILDIQTGGSCYHIEFSEDSYTAVGGACTVTCTLQQNYAPLPNVSVSLTDGSSVYSSITNQYGVAEFNLTGLISSGTWTCTYQNVSDTCTVSLATYLFFDGGVTGNYNSNYSKSNNGVNVNVTSDGTIVSSSYSGDCYYYEDVLISGDFRAEATIVSVNKYGGVAFFNTSHSRQWFIECNLADNHGWDWEGNTTINSDKTLPTVLKVERIGTTLSIYFNDVLISTQTVTNIDGYLGWKTHSHSSRNIKFRDFSIISL